MNDRSRDNPLTGTREIDIDTYGGAAAVLINDRLRVGGGVSVYTFHLDGSFRRLGVSGTDVFGPVDLTFADGLTAVQSSDDVAFGFNIGLQVTLTPQWRIGGVFRKFAGLRVHPGGHHPVRPTLERDGVFQVPDIAAIGVAWRPHEAMTVAADYVHVGYGGLKEDFVNFQAISSGREDQLRIDDGSEFHAGFEWMLSQVRFAPALRIGLWLDPEHMVTSTLPMGQRRSARCTIRIPAARRRGSRPLLVWGGSVDLKNVRVNAAADLSKRGAHASASIILRFF